MIKTGKHIDANGKIYLPYLHEWKHVSLSFSLSIFFLFLFRVSCVCTAGQYLKTCITHMTLFVMVSLSCLIKLPFAFLLQPQSDLYGLIQVMIVVFGEEPPVFSRPTTQPPYQAFQAAGTPNRRRPFLFETSRQCSGFDSGSQPFFVKFVCA